MTPAELTEYLEGLKRVAELATPGPYRISVSSPRKTTGLCFAQVAQDKAGGLLVSTTTPHDGAFIASANPKTLLALVDVVEGLVGALEKIGVMTMPMSEWPTEAMHEASYWTRWLGGIFYPLNPGDTHRERARIGARQINDHLARKGISALRQARVATGLHSFERSNVLMGVCRLEKLPAFGTRSISATRRGFRDIKASPVMGVLQSESLIESFVCE